MTAAAFSVGTIVAIVGILAAPVLSYLAVVWKFSGKVGKTDAATLWKVTEDIRKDYATRLKAADARIETLEGRLETLRDELVMSRDALRSLQDQMSAHEAAT